MALVTLNPIGNDHFQAFKAAYPTNPLTKLGNAFAGCCRDGLVIKEDRLGSATHAEHQHWHTAPVGHRDYYRLGEAQYFPKVLETLNAEKDAATIGIYAPPTNGLITALTIGVYNNLGGWKFGISDRNGLFEGVEALLIKKQVRVPEDTCKPTMDVAQSTVEVSSITIEGSDELGGLKSDLITPRNYDLYILVFPAPLYVPQVDEIILSVKESTDTVLNKDNFVVDFNLCYDDICPEPFHE